jgi:hypothetical protein
MGVTFIATGPVKMDKIPDRFRHTIRRVISDYGKETEFRDNELYNEFYSTVAQDLKVLYVNWGSNIMVYDTPESDYKELSCPYSLYGEFKELLTEIELPFKDTNTGWKYVPCLINMGGANGFVFESDCKEYLDYLEKFRFCFDEDADDDYDFDNEATLKGRIKNKNGFFNRLYELVKIGANNGCIMVG